jgi:hypothetical protein
MTIFAIILSIASIIGAGLFGDRLWYWIAVVIGIVVFHLYFRPLRKEETTQEPDPEPLQTVPETKPPSTVRSWTTRLEEKGVKIMVLIGAIICLATGVANLLACAVLVNVGVAGHESITYQGIVLSFAAFGAPAIVGLVVANDFSKKLRPHNFFVRRIVDFGTSVALAVVSVSVALYATFMTDTSVVLLAQIWALTFWAWFVDIGNNQADNVHEVTGGRLGTTPPGIVGIGTQQVAFPPPPNFTFPGVTDATVRDMMLNGKGPFLLVQNIQGPPPA